MVSGSRHPTQYCVVLSLEPLRSRDADANLLVRHSSVSPPCRLAFLSCSHVLPSRPKNGGQGRIRKPAAAEHCCPTATAPTAKCPMRSQDMSPFPSCIVHMSRSYRVAGQGRAEAGNSKKRASNVHKLWASSVT